MPTEKKKAGRRFSSQTSGGQDPVWRTQKTSDRAAGSHGRGKSRSEPPRLTAGDLWQHLADSGLLIQLNIKKIRPSPPDAARKQVPWEPPGPNRTLAAGSKGGFGEQRREHLSSCGAAQSWEMLTGGAQTSAPHLNTAGNKTPKPTRHLCCWCC